MKTRILLLVFFSTQFIYAVHYTFRVRTGPSYGYSKISPFAYSEKGTVLFLTQYFINEMGAHDMMDTEFGYLLVNANGLWEEKVLKTVLNQDGFDSLTKYENMYFAKSNTFINHQLDSVIKKYDLKLISTSKNNPLYTWTPNGIYDNNNNIINTDASQRSLHNHFSSKGKGVRNNSIFAYQKVLLFENKTIYDGENDSVYLSGAQFFENDFTYPLEQFQANGVVVLNN